MVIPAGVPPRPGMSSDEVFNVNASIVSNLTNAIAENCPAALVAVISNPINSMVPIVSGVMKQWGVYDPRKVEKNKIKIVQNRKPVKSVKRIRI